MVAVTSRCESIDAVIDSRLCFSRKIVWMVVDVWGAHMGWAECSLVDEGFQVGDPNANEMFFGAQSDGRKRILFDPVGDGAIADPENSRRLTDSE